MIPDLHSIHTARATHATRTKICGLTNEDDRDVAVAAGADGVGFVAGVPIDTPREIESGHAAELVASTPPFVTSVLVTMPETPNEGIELAEEVNPDAIQVHGSLSATELETLTQKIDAAVIATVAADHGIDSHEERETRENTSEPDTSHELLRKAAAADAVLVDSADAAGGGGTGETHDWERTRAVVKRLDAPVILAGGLTPQNVASAVRTVEPFAVDVSTGTERTGGRKDHDAVREFIERATSARVVRA